MKIETVTEVTSIVEGVSNITTYVKGLTPNTAPVLSDFNLRLDENSEVVLDQASLLQNYFDAEEDLPLDLRIVSLTERGDVTFNGDEAQLNQTIPFADISLIKFKPLGNQYGEEYASLQIQVRDDGVAPNNWSNSANIIFDVTKLNTEPTVDDNEVSIEASENYIFTIEDFTKNYFDQENDSFGYIEIETLPSIGELYFENNLVTSSNLPLRVDALSLQQGELEFRNPNELNANVTISFEVFDNVD